MVVLRPGRNSPTVGVNYITMPNWTLHQGDCLDVLKRAPAPKPEPVTTPTPETEAPLTLDDLFGF